MAKFDINETGQKTDSQVEANREPTPPVRRLRIDSTRMRVNKGGLRRCDRGLPSQGLLTAMSACFLAVISTAAADPTTATTPDPPPRTGPPTVPPANFRPTWDLDGGYLWLGPLAAASRIEGQLDSTVGGEATIVRVREGDLLGTVGGSFGGSLWTARGGGRLWLDGVVGTSLGGHMVGLTAGPIVELGKLSHARYGGSIGIWGFAGVIPYARIGAVQELGMFAEVGLHIDLPAWRQ